MGLRPFFLLNLWLTYLNTKPKGVGAGKEPTPPPPPYRLKVKVLMRNHAGPSPKFNLLGVRL